MEVVVIGGGAIGLACAFSLTRTGARVTVLERDRCGGATSSGTARPHTHARVPFVLEDHESEMR